MPFKIFISLLRPISFIDFSSVEFKANVHSQKLSLAVQFCNVALILIY